MFHVVGFSCLAGLLILLAVNVTTVSGGNTYLILSLQFVSQCEEGGVEVKTYQFVLCGNPQPRSDPPIVRMARWPKTPGELGKCTGAESVRTIRWE